ncbi:MAG: hypothetical protein A2Z12_09795 [Actinobacteria bacterium RBG_16_68_21]|nr:MAG: hypothetical protein A2Z12_09795 [Actinobacteria bacterium RBG_16_68_21]
MITRRARLWISRGVAAALLGGLVVLVGSTWWYAGRIRAELVGGTPSGGPADEVVVAVDRDSVTLPRDAATIRPGIWGLEFAGGHAELGEVLALGDDVVTRRIDRITGSLAVGMPVAFDRMVFAGDPATRRVTFADVIVPGPLGDYSAWLGEGDGDTWLIFVHDRGADRRESLRVLPTAALLGLPTLVITYRGDVGAPPGGGGIGVGSAEWPDLQDAVDFAITGGAAQVVLMGSGVGGSIIELFMRESRLADRVAGIVLDSPLLDAGERVRRRAAADKVPGFILRLSQEVAALRFGVEWSDLDHVSHVGEIAVPTLIIHGDQDTLYPVEVSRQYAAAAPTMVDLVIVAGAGHGEAWNLDPVRYEHEVAGFLEAVAP